MPTAAAQGRGGGRPTRARPGGCSASTQPRRPAPGVDASAPAISARELSAPARAGRRRRWRAAAGSVRRTRSAVARTRSARRSAPGSWRRRRPTAALTAFAASRKAQRHRLHRRRRSRSPPAAGWRGTAAARARRRSCLRGTPRPRSPAVSAAAIWWTTRSASRLRSRSMNERAAAADQPAEQRPAPHVGLGDEARRGTTALIARMSSHETWLATSRTAGTALARPARRAMPSTREQPRRPPATRRVARRVVEPRGTRTGTISQRHAARWTTRAARRRAAARTRRCTASFRRLVGDAAGDQRAAHAARQLVAEERRVLALARQRRAASTVQRSAGSNMHRSATPPSTQADPAPAASPSTRGEHRGRRGCVTVASVCAQRQLARVAPLQRERSSSSSPVAPGSASPNGSCFASSSTGVWSQTSASIVPSASARAQRVAVALLAQRRHQAASRHRSSRCPCRSGAAWWMRDVAGDRQPFGLGARAPASTPSALESRHRCTRAPVSRTSSRIVGSATVSAITGTPGRPSRVATCAVVRDAVAPSDGVLRAQPHREAERRRVLQRAQQHAACRRAARRPARRRRSRLRCSSAISVSALALRARASARRADRRAPGSRLRARNLSISTRPGSSSGGSVSGGQARLVTPPATAAAISDSSVALYSKPGSRSRAARSTRPGATTRPRRVDRRGRRAKPAGAAPMRRRSCPSAIDRRRRSRRRPLAGIDHAAARRIVRSSCVVARDDAHHRHAHRDAERHLRQDHRLRAVGDAESISTPRFIGPGCITIASGLASASFSGVRP